ncbi:aminotransferase class I/II-fold pyridoxal phosphate-dependent enzyme [Alkalicella caledoniensis]|uniref:cysteine-S-conjugate beta-lyase n=1 Tax=Alkalicella caledoniensis TaxID=2731377 RepID=A0A7G9WAW3_ALKCA|nr:aminotransferase class I/II-fold pyridoxal phosphate-dependent enzyme [Alkalicella caledoniensis]QNO15825.1 aminotransferase class I/II-fold pyridoxal phosphate-dependent enzyme [Alkalicella caledoniensis]
MNFDKVINRKGTYCTQWDYIEDRFGKGNSVLVPYSISDTDFQAPVEIINEIKKRADHGIFGYSRWDHDDYKNSIVNWYQERYNTRIKKDWVVYSPSVLYTISTLMELLAGENKKIMSHTPRYDGFSKIFAHYEVINIPLEETQKGIFKTDLSTIEQGFKSGIKVLVLCNPDNPTGKVWKKDELEELISLAKKYKGYIISDEVHMDITRREPTSVLKIDAQCCISVNSPTKTFNTPSLGGSYAVIPDTHIRGKYLKQMKEVHSVGSPPIFGVLSTITGYNECAYWVDDLNNYVRENCELVVNELDGYKGLEVYVPEATFLMWINFKKTNIKLSALKESLIKNGNVAIMSGDIYGDSYRLRLNVGCPRSKLEYGIKGIKKAVDSIKV